MTPPATTSPTHSPTSSPTYSSTSSPSPSPASTPPERHRSSPTPDPRNRFYTDDKTWYASPWYAGRHQIMVEYGCTPAPYYAPDPRCRSGQGFHHGIDIAMPCGTEITAGVDGRVIDPRSPGTPGAAYGRTAFRIRTAAGQDILIGHARRVFVRPGDRVRRGERIALAGARGAPDGCHLHLEVRPAGGGYTDAVNPLRVARLRR
ncbi:MAG: M23 family metallopeptidase [Microlunatus sp.]|nr:M23 family metallopeptidase [Microlunatus sp.]